ncbi:MAG: DNA polymerase III subunit chi [Rhodobacteraceae bacterium]|nr:DNA polymerase III subunit chi [Paracoccaceae bacterium]
MAEVLFYHLTNRRLEATLPELLLKSQARGWRALVRCGSIERARDLSRLLWTFDAGAFVPHGTREEPMPQRQPVYLTDGEEIPNEPEVLFLVDGAEASVEEVSAAQRTCLMFSDADTAAKQAARGWWKTYTDAGLAAAYWAEEGGRWVKKQEKKQEKNQEKKAGDDEI